MPQTAPWEAAQVPCDFLERVWKALGLVVAGQVVHVQSGAEPLRYLVVWHELAA